MMRVCDVVFFIFSMLVFYGQMGPKGSPGLRLVIFICIIWMFINAKYEKRA
jgi:hypothetical protein